MAAISGPIKRNAAWHLPVDLIQQIDKAAMKEAHASDRRVKPSHVVERLLREGLARKPTPEPASTPPETN